MSTHAAQRSESDLLIGLLRRDPEALADLYDRYSALTYSVLLRVTHDPSASEDLMQEVFLRAWTRIQDFDLSRGALSSWLAAISRNLAIDFLRSVRTRANLQFQALQHIDMASSPPRHSSIESLDIISKTFPKLSDGQRIILEMAYFEGCSQSEIAQKLSTPLGTVKSRMRSALQQLRSAFERLSVPQSTLSGGDVVAISAAAN